MLDFYFLNGAKSLLGVDPIWAYIALAINVVVYFFFYEYFDAIIPNAYGISKNCCCCFSYCRTNKAKLDDEEDEVWKEEIGTKPHDHDDP
jgi:hypothetical protein